MASATSKESPLDCFMAGKQFVLENKCGLESASTKQEQEKQQTIESEREIAGKICAEITRLEQEVEVDRKMRASPEGG
jgi:hypothetical protein